MNIEPSKTIVVLCATGQQGGAVPRALKADGRWKLRALSRSPASESAARLKERGFDVVAGDMDNPQSLKAPDAGAYGVYSDQGSDVETRRGIAVADAALAAGLRYFVFASVGRAERRSAVPHFESKWPIEEHVRAIGLPATVMRRVYELYAGCCSEPSMIGR